MIDKNMFKIETIGTRTVEISNLISNRVYMWIRYQIASYFMISDDNPIFCSADDVCRVIEKLNKKYTLYKFRLPTSREIAGMNPWSNIRHLPDFEFVYDRGIIKVINKTTLSEITRYNKAPFRIIRENNYVRNQESPWWSLDTRFSRPSFCCC